jgi:hypothetical protein
MNCRHWVGPKWKTRLFRTLFSMKLENMELGWLIELFAKAAIPCLHTLDWSTPPSLLLLAHTVGKVISTLNPPRSKRRETRVPIHIKQRLTHFPRTIIASNSWTLPRENIETRLKSRQQPSARAQLRQRADTLARGRKDPIDLSAIYATRGSPTSVTGIVISRLCIEVKINIPVQSVERFSRQPGILRGIRGIIARVDNTLFCHERFLDWLEVGCTITNRAVVLSIPFLSNIRK